MYLRVISGRSNLSSVLTCFIMFSAEVSGWASSLFDSFEESSTGGSIGFGLGWGFVISLCSSEGNSSFDLSSI